MPEIDISELPVGHGARPVAGRALAVSAIGALLFTVFAAVTTQVTAVRTASPWQDDPYDAVVTFTMFFVPGLSGVAALRVLLCRRKAPLPVYRVDQLLRATLLVLVLVDLTVLTDWVSLAVRADRQLWTARTPALVAGLALVTVAAGVAHIAVRRARALIPRPPVGAGDWLGDIVVGVALLAARMGDPDRFGGPRRALAFINQFLRAHFVVMTALGSIAVGVLVIARMSLAEGSSDRALFAVEAVVFAGGAYCFVMIADAWLQLAATPSHARHPVMRVGTTAAAAALPVSLALRGLIWSATGHRSDVDTATQLAAVTFTSAVVCGVVATLVAYAVTSSQRRS